MDNAISLEAERIKTVKKYEILDTPPDGSFDHITHLASEILNVPVAIVSIVDTDRIWFKSRVGVAVDQIGRSPGLCASAILSDDLYLVQNARNDPRTLANPLVAGEFGLQFYAAVPLKVKSGYNLGTLCVIDRQPRIFSAKEQRVLEDLGQVLIDQLELRLASRQANAKQNQLLGMIAHELKNPLTTIPVYADLISKTNDKQSIISMCDQIKKASEKMNVLIADMLETARLQAKEIYLKKTFFDMAMIVGRICSMNLVLANTKYQKVFLDVGASAMVYADEMRIGEIIDNLLNNAIKYSPAESEISVKLTSTQEFVILEITDQGPGFTDTDKQNLFMPFIRLSAKPTNGENSTGIGLSIVKVLVDAHEGKISVQNNPEGKGARILVQIPSLKRKA